MISFLMWAALAAIVVVLMLLALTHVKTGGRVVTYARERVERGLRLLKTKHGVGAVLPGGRFALFAKDPTVTVEELTEKLVAIKVEAEAVQQVADQEKRDLTEEESQKVEGLLAAFDATEAEIGRRTKIAALANRLETPSRRTRPEDVVVDRDSEPLRPSARITGGAPAAVNEKSKGTGGFRNMGDFAVAVRKAAGGEIDPRLRVLNAAPSTYSQEGVGADGGYLIPPDFRTSILQKVLGEDQLLGRTDQQTTTSNSITIPVDETTPWQTTGGIQAYWEGEAATYLQSKAALQTISIRAYKLGAIVPVTDEQLEDGPALEAYLRRKTPDKMNFKVNDALLNGDGVGKPMGILKSPALVTQAAEGGQTAGTVVYNNVTKMWSRMYAPCRARGVWIINQDVEPQLFSMVVPGGSPALPAYLPPGGLSDRPYGMLLGRPVIYSEASQAVGTVGDIVFADLTQYLSVIKAGGIRSDVSIHLWFDQGLTAFRFNMRLGGAGWWQNSITRFKSALPLSCFVALAAR